MTIISKDYKQLFIYLKEVLTGTTKKNKKLFILTAFLWGFCGISGIVYTWVSATLLSSIQEHLNQTTLVGILIFWSVVISMFPQVCGWASNFKESTINIFLNYYSDHIYLKNLEKIFHRPELSLSGQSTLKIIEVLNRACQNVRNGLWRCMQAIMTTMAFVVSACILLFNQPMYAVIILIFLVVIAQLKLKIETKYNPKSELELVQVKNGTESADHIDNLENIHALCLEKEVLKELRAHRISYRDLSYELRKKLCYNRIPIYFLNGISTIIITLMAVSDALKSGDVGRFVLITGMASSMVVNGTPLSFFFGEMAVQFKSYKKLMGELEYDHKLDLKVGKGKLPEGGTIEFKDVSFTYPESKTPVLNKLSLKIKQGDRVAIIGHSGMGKSTLINVMQHVYEIQSGKVLINNKNIQSVSLQSLRKAITYINQHAVFWNQKNIKENLLMFNPKATDVELYQALKSANLLEEMTHKEKGLESKVSALSAGQKQRLAMARAFLRQTPIIIMDEPTANLDTNAQTKVLEGIKNLSKVKGHKPTVIFASNVPAEIASANRVLLLENGRIVEDGNPKKLMSNPNSKVFKRLKRYKALFLEK